uniref:Protein FAM50 homolog n=1 Tax=Aceria tosichella TaxID=561515 RepID=A0A6G1SDZ2_9ACAR
MAHYKGDANEATRAMHISRRREKAKEELEEKRKKIEGDVKLSTIDNQFSTHTDSVEAQLKSSTVGLVTLDQMRQKQENAVKEREKQLAQKETDGSLKIGLDHGLKKSSIPTKNSKSLSFYDDDDEDEDDDEDDKNEDTKPKCDDCNGSEGINELPANSPKSDDSDNTSSFTTNVRKKPKLAWDKIDIDTSLLPDRDREEEERRLREELAAEWRERQQRLKEEEIEITFSYWDGSGHRRVVRMKKGDSIYQFLQACLETLRKDFNELRSVSADQLVYVKEDLIIPHHYTFYDFIVTKARGKSGPLFSFDVHEDVRLVADASVEKDESHAGKVLLRSWYERNKHIFPASRWEPYDPTKTYDKYTISDKRSK